MCGFQAISVKAKILQKGDCERVKCYIRGQRLMKIDFDTADGMLNT